jgi:predicted acylesterase/phospholipase RssA
MANPVPVDVARRMGADFVIACDVSKSAQTKNSRGKHVNPQNIINIEKYKNTLKETGVYKEFNRKLNDFLSENSDLAKKHKQIMGRISQLTSKGSEAIDKDTPDIFYTLAQALFSMEARVIKSYLKNADLVIRPDTDNIDTYDFHKGNEAIEKGYSSAAAALAKLVKRGL